MEQELYFNCLEKKLIYHRCSCYQQIHGNSNRLLEYNSPEMNILGIQDMQLVRVNEIIKLNFTSVSKISKSGSVTNSIYCDSYRNSTIPRRSNTSDLSRADICCLYSLSPESTRQGACVLEASSSDCYELEISFMQNF